MNSPTPTDVMPRRHLAAWAIGSLIALAALLMIAAASAFIYVGVNLFNEQAHAAIRADPVVARALGKITDIELDMTATGNAPGAEDFAYRVTGDLASGLLVGRFVTTSADTEELRSGTLTLDDGRHLRIGTELDHAGARSGDDDRNGASATGASPQPD
jgi:hypothetical protein